jgi:uncharacterized protein YpmS
MNLANLTLTLRKIRPWNYFPLGQRGSFKLWKVVFAIFQMFNVGCRCLVVSINRRRPSTQNFEEFVEKRSRRRIETFQRRSTQTETGKLLNSFF